MFRRKIRIYREFRLKNSSFNPDKYRGLKILENYNIKPVRIVIGDLSGQGVYLVDEPKVTDEEKQLYNLVMNTLYFTLKPVETSSPEEYIKSKIDELAYYPRFKHTSWETLEKIKYYIARDTVGYGILDPLIRDPRIEDISCEGIEKPVKVFHRDYSIYDWLNTNIVFESDDEVDNIASILAHRSGKHVSVAFPMVDGSLPEKHRVAITFSREISPFGSSFTIRKFRETPLTIAHLIKFKTVSPLMAAYWWLLLENKGSIFIVGEMASGKTTLLNALTTMLPPSWKIVTIEDVPELRLPHDGWKPLVARHVFTLAEAKTEVSLFDLVKLSLRERAQFIAVGEIRGEEAYVFVQSIATGHGGSCTFHGDSVESMVMRLTMPPINVPVSFLPLISNVVIMHFIKIPGKKPLRRVTEVNEIIGVSEPRNVVYQRIFEWNPEKDEHFPKTVEEVVNKSEKLEKIRRFIGWTRNMVVEELERRKNFLEKLADENILDYPDVVKKLREFYAVSR